jgi:hypothetical protein
MRVSTRRAGDRRTITRRASQVVLIGAILAVFSSVLPQPPSTNAAGRAKPLAPGDAIFWTTPYVKDASNSESGPRACKRERCFVYRLDVAAGGERLRVAIDYPFDSGIVRVRLVTPHGKRVSAQSRGFYSEEVFVKRPSAGIYTVEVIPLSLNGSAVRLRAKLETPGSKGSTPGSKGSTPRALLPNLRLEPPFDFNFGPPSTMVGGVTAGGFGVSSCSADEVAENGARRCLRLAVGPQNAGVGPLELRFSPLADAATGEAPMYQLVHHSDGSVKEREAGTYEYHKTHGHYHFTGFADLELFSVADPDEGGLAPAGVGNKSGFCFGDVMMNSWSRFIQARAASSRSSCEDTTEAYMGLSAGWTDIYSSDTPGNYVEFGDNPDGYYVVRAEVDGADQILESDESDNVSYAFIQVTGDRVKVVERGFGRDPWDPNKKVYRDWVERLRR